MREQDIVERIINLTAKALAEKERDKFVQRLKERNLLLAPSVSRHNQNRRSPFEGLAPFGTRCVGPSGKGEGARLERDGEPFLEEKGCAPVDRPIPFSSDAGILRQDRIV